MRNTDPDPQPFKPLGEKVVPPAPKSPDWKTLEHNKRIEKGPDGKLRTNGPLPPTWFPR